MRASSPRPAVRGALLAAALVAALPLAAQEPVPADTLVRRQLEAGEQWYRAVCLECHASNLADADFKAKWNGRTAYDLFDRMRNTMPDSDPGSLTPETYAALTAYLLRINGMPSAAAPVTTDSTALAAVTLAFPPTLR